MRNGCAGFFTREALAGGRGLAADSPPPREGHVAEGLVADPGPDPPSSLSAEGLDAIRRGDLSPLGPRFRELSADGAAPLPGGRLALVGSAPLIDRQGGASGRGFIRCESPVDPDAWYLRCHFPEDEVMPGTLMYDASLQAFRLYLMSLGWIPGPGRAFVPTPGAPASLKCRGQVVPGVRTVHYDVHVRELSLRSPAPDPPAGRRPGRPAKRPPEPCAVADAIMWADGRPVVEVTGMALTLAGGSLEQLSAQFREKRPKGRPPLASPSRSGHRAGTARPDEAGTARPGEAGAARGYAGVARGGPDAAGGPWPAGFPDAPGAAGAAEHAPKSANDVSGGSAVAPPDAAGTQDAPGSADGAGRAASASRAQGRSTRASAPARSRAGSGVAGARKSPEPHGKGTRISGPPPPEVPDEGGGAGSRARAAEAPGVRGEAAPGDAGHGGAAEPANSASATRENPAGGTGKAFAEAAGVPDGPPYVYPPEKVRRLSSGPVSGAFGPLFSRFDSGAFWPHMPQAPYDFMDEVEVVKGELGVVADGSELVARHVMDPSRWTFAEAGGAMALPYAAINETALQPCGFLASFMGSYLPFAGPMHFRNLGGDAVTLKTLSPSDAGELVTRSALERHSVLGETAIQHYRFTVSLDGETVYEGRTHFGFLSPENLARQEGLKLQRGEDPFPPPPPDAEAAVYPRGAAWPSGRWRMVDRLLWERLPAGAVPERCWGRTAVRPGAWFFSAHFPQDPVWPGSLGLEAFFQAGKALAMRLFCPGTELSDAACRFTAPVPGMPHSWLYRGQIVPVSRECAVGIQATGTDDARKILTFRGTLWADDLPIYRVDNFTVQIHGL
ncbi:MAG: hypothetical protein LBT40_03875 [Deltaproteobacteria bacterium]|nr:hypothetical protein [Deltaproteobacteria bacterium]